MAPISEYIVWDSGEAAINDNPKGKYLPSIVPLDDSNPNVMYIDFSMMSFMVLGFILLREKSFLRRVISFKKIATY